MTTIRISIDQQLDEQIESFAKEDGVSKNVMVQRLLKQAVISRRWDEMQVFMQPKFRELGIETEEELYDYLESDETYADRVMRLRKANLDMKSSEELSPIFNSVDEMFEHLEKTA